MADTMQSTPSSSLVVSHSSATPDAPDAQRISHRVTAPFGASREDVYYWLRDDSRQDKAVIDYLNAENAYTDALLTPLEGFKQTLYDEIVERIPKDDVSVPYQHRGYWYYSRFSEGFDYPIIARRVAHEDATALSILALNEAGDFTEEEVVLDENVLAEGKDFFNVGAVAVSPDTRRVAWAEDDNGRRQYRIRIKDIASGEIIEEGPAGVSGNIVWASDSAAFLYIENDPETLLTTRVKRHRLGEALSDDVLLYEEEDHTFYLHLTKTRDERFITLIHLSTDTVEMRYTDAANPATLTPLAPRETGLRYQADHFAGRWIVSTNADGAENFKLMTAPTDCSSRTAWQEWLPYDPAVVIEDIELFEGVMAISERSHGLERIRLLSDTGEQHYVEADEEVYSMGLGVNPDPSSRWMRYGYTSLTTPSTLFELNLETGERRQLKQQQVHAYDASRYKAERRWIKARDNTDIPVSIVYHRDTPLDGTAPLYQYGYGSYGACMDPGFSASRISLLDRGVIYAIAHIRGGGEMGRQWYNGGRLHNKQNTFSDFVDVTRGLVTLGYADPARIAAAGGSAGGLLMGAIANQAADEYRVLEAHVPFVDVVTTMLDPSIPLTTNEYDEWGNPEQQDFYDCILAYSPYDNVVEQAYPAMYISTGLWDSQVQYWEPAKWVAKLRDRNQSEAPLVFRVNMEAGHGGKSGRFKRFEEVAESYAFVLDQLGLATH